MGVVSLSFIDLVKKTCDVAMVVNTSMAKTAPPYILPLESMARITEHAFNCLGINRISGGQHVGLVRWQNRMELLGYKLESMHKNKFIKGPEVADTVTISCVREDFLAISERRGSLWDSSVKMDSRLKRLPEISFANKMKVFFETERKEYYDRMFSL